MSDQKLAAAKALLEDKRRSVTEVARQLGISRASLYRALAR
jgi:DNA-binding phage protein